MPQPIALCIEDADAAGPQERFLRCTALVGRQPGLRLDPSGDAHWRDEQGASACELWVSADQQLIALRPAGAATVVLRRAGRSLELPADKPVVLLDQDRLEVGPRRLKLHIHGLARSVAAPSPFVPRSGVRGAAGVAAVVALGAAVAACERPIHVREQPPEVPPEQAGAPPDPQTAATSAPTVTIATAGTATSTETESSTQGPPPATAATSAPVKPPPIEVREEPPDMVMEEPD